MALENILLSETCKNITDDLLEYKDVEWPDLQIQLELFKRKRPITSLSDAVSALKCMPPELRAEYSEVEKLVCLLLVSQQLPQRQSEALALFVG